MGKDDYNSEGDDGSSIENKEVGMPRTPLVAKLHSSVPDMIQTDKITRKTTQTKLSLPPLGSRTMNNVKPNSTLTIGTYGRGGRGSSTFKSLAQRRAGLGLSKISCACKSKVV